MPNHPWLERLRQALVRRRVPARLRARLLAELRDHWIDLHMEGESMEALEARLGTPDEIAAVAEAEHRRRFCQRHPAVTFLLGPVPALVALMALYLAVVSGLAWGRGLFSDTDGVPGAAQLSSADRFAIVGAVRALGFVPFALAAWLFVRIARRAELNLRWPLAACGLLAITALGFSAQLVLPTAPGNGSFSVGFNLPPSTIQVFQLAVPLAIGGWFVARSRRGGSSYA